MGRVALTTATNSKAASKGGPWDRTSYSGLVCLRRACTRSRRRRRRLRFGCVLLLARRQNRVQNRPFHARHELDHAGVANILNQPIDDLVAQFAVRHLAAAEAQASLHLVAVDEEPHGLILLGLVVMLIHGNGELDFLDDDDLLL